MSIDTLLRNPMSIWITRLLKKIYYETKYRNKRLKIGYMSSFDSCEFGHNNVIHDDVFLTNCKFGNYNTLYTGVRLAKVDVGDFSYVAPGGKLNNASIGKFTCIGPEVMAGLGRHPSRDFISIHPAFYSTLHQIEITFVNQSYFEEFEPIEIGHDVWIGARAIILDGIKIGDGVIIAAGSVVTNDIPNYAVVAGAPARVLRYRFGSQEVDFLKKIKWWDRDVTWLRNNAEKFQSASDFMKISDEAVNY